MTDEEFDQVCRSVNDHDIANAVQELWLRGKLSDDLSEMIAEKAVELCALRLQEENEE